MITRRHILAIAGLPPAVFGRSKPKFSGVWKLNPAGSTLKAPPDLVHTIDQSGNTIYVGATFNRSASAGLILAGLLAPELLLVADGTEVSGEVPPGLKLQSQSRWDGDKLVTSWVLTGLPAGLADRGTWVRSLADGGRAMVVELHSSAEGKLLFTKK